MGVPAFFRWLSRKYPSIVVSCVEEKPKVVNGTQVPVDASEKNPNDVEFDNLYLDMNGIIHPCCHPEDKPAPKNEDEMMVLIFEYIDRLIAIVRPRRVLYMAIDGVAPRAKMNQQRSRRFRAAKEAREKIVDMARIKDDLRAKGFDVPPDKAAGEHFDSNCITPGTPFMFRLAECLRYYIHDRLNHDPGWKGVKVILSDANVPGEGEHKIMDFIRHQRGQPDHDPNTHHCLCGADADLIMLGLATHEPYFTIIREEFKANKPRPCEICNQMGHEMKECQGLPKVKQGEFDELSKPFVEEQLFIFLRINILREYLENELRMTNLPFKQDIERAIDDWVFMCFFVGNDFLPHLPSLQIREGAIDRLVKLYKETVQKTGGYLTDQGFLNKERVQVVLSELGKAEDEIFRSRRQTDLHFRKRDKDNRKRARKFQQSNRPSFMMGGQYAPQAPGQHKSLQNPRQTAAEGRIQSLNQSNQQAADSLRSMMTQDGSSGNKRKADDLDSDEEPEPEDEVKLWEDGWKDRYYQSKFSVENEDIDFRHTVGNEYVLGLCWVLLYYYQGCPSWKWYFPYHYAPFASDFVNIGDLNTDFEKNTQPFKPLEQLMGVFPAASKQFLPSTWQDLMDNTESPILDFYPEDFAIDLNGKKYAWQGVALLPFVDEKRLLTELRKVYPDLTSDENARNIRGSDRLFVGKGHDAYTFFEGLYESGGTKEEVEADPSLLQGMKGMVWCDKCVVLQGHTVPSPLSSLEDVENNQAIVVEFMDPQYDPDHVFTAAILKNAKMPDRVLKPEDFNKKHPGQGYRPQLGFTRGSGYRGRGSYNPQVANRMARGSMRGSGQGQYGQVAPVQSLMTSQGGYNQRQDRSSSQGRNWNQGRQGGYNDNRSSGHQRSNSYGGQSSWQQSQQGQQNAYQQNQQRGYGNQGGGNYGHQGRGNYGNNQQGNYGNNQGGYGVQRDNRGSGGRSHPGYGMVSELSDSHQIDRRGYPQPPQKRSYDDQGQGSSHKRW